MRRPPVLLVTAALLLAESPQSHAGACPPAQLRVYPSNDSNVPTNTQVRVEFEADSVTVAEVDPATRGILKSEVVSAAEALVEIRKPGGAIVVASLRRLPTVPKPVIVVIPRQPLDPQTKHTVVVRSKTQSFQVGQFTTGTTTDQTPPTLGAVTRTQYAQHHPTDWKDTSGVTASISFAGATDADTFEVHELQGTGGVSDTTLRALVRGDAKSAAKVVLHDGGPCHSATYRFPNAASGARPRTLRLAIRAIDSAGNTSAAREVSLDLTRLRRP